MQEAYWPDAGAMKGNLYTNNFFGFSGELPKGWKVLDKDQLRTLQGRVIEKTVERGGNRERAEVAAQTQMAGAVDDVRKKRFVIWRVGPKRNIRIPNT